MKQHLFLAGSLLLFPKLIAPLLLIRIVILIKWVKFIFFLITLSLIAFIILFWMFFRMVISVFSEGFRNIGNILKALLYVLALLAAYHTIRYLFGRLSRKFEELPQTIVPSVHSIKRVVHIEVH